MKIMNGNDEREQPQQKGLFTSVPLSKKSPMRSNRNSDEEVYFPKLEQASSVDTLWMVGFLHHEKKSKEKKVIIIE